MLRSSSLIALAFSLLGSSAASAGDREGRVHVLPSRESTMVRIPSGAFGMGAPIMGEKAMTYFEQICIEDYKASADALCYIDSFGLAAIPAREVHLGSFEIDRYEVQVSEYRECVRAGGCDIGPLLFGDQRYNKSNWPIVNVRWGDATQYCKWHGKRLPTEAEWEKAARGSKSELWPWGPVWRKGASNHGMLVDDLILKLKTIQRKGRLLLEEYAPDKSDGHAYASAPGDIIWGDSPYGVANMAGNVREWVQDYYSDEGYAGLPAINPVRDSPPSGETRRSVRGGSWTMPRLLGLSFVRVLPQAPAQRNIDLGFRCAR